jgi:nucleoside-diphosphate-sugar epimerase
MKHVILGSGPVGVAAAIALARRHERVHLVSRTRPSELPEGVAHTACDVRDVVSLGRACDGAAVLYQCLNAPYHRWREEFPGLQRAAVSAAREVHARYVSFENVYMYGAPGPAPFVETQAHAPCSDKGCVRAEMVDELRRLHDTGELEVTHVRASDLFGPGMRGSALGEEVVGRAVAGRGARGFGDLQAPHTWTFTRDAGETLAAAGLTTEALGRVWHAPSDAPRSQHEVVAELSRLLGRDVKLSATPPWILRLVGLFRPEASEMIEMAYEFERPFVVDDRATRAALAVGHTPLAEALAATVSWYRAAAAPSKG